MELVSTSLNLELLKILKTYNLDYISATEVIDGVNISTSLHKSDNTGDE